MYGINARDDVGNPCWSEVLGGIVELYEGGSGREGGGWECMLDWSDE